MTLRKRVDELKDCKLELILGSNGHNLYWYIPDKKRRKAKINLIKLLITQQQLLDRAMQGLEYYAEFNRYQVTPPYVDIKIAQQTLADIRKALGDNNGG